MQLRDSIEYVLEHYLEHKHKNFNFRNKIADVLTNQMPDQIKDFLPETVYKTYGSIGMGKWANVPWVVVMDKKIARQTKKGLYVGYLFSEDMERVYLTLTAGMSNIENDFGKRYGRKVMKVLVDSKRRTLTTLNQVRDFNQEGVKIGSGRLGQIYEVGTILYKCYPKNELPSNQVLESDLIKMKEVYDAYLSYLENYRERQLKSYDVLISHFSGPLDERTIKACQDYLEDYLLTILYGRVLNPQTFDEVATRFFRLSAFQGQPYSLIFDSDIYRLCKNERDQVKFLEKIIFNPITFMISYTKNSVNNIKTILLQLKMMLSYDDRMDDFKYFIEELKNIAWVNHQTPNSAQSHGIRCTLLYFLFKYELNDEETKRFILMIANDFNFMTLGRSILEICFGLYEREDQLSILDEMLLMMKSSVNGEMNVRHLSSEKYLGQRDAELFNFKSFVLNELTKIVVDFILKYSLPDFKEMGRFVEYEVSSDDYVLELKCESKELQILRKKYQSNGTEGVIFKILVNDNMARLFRLTYKNGLIEIDSGEKFSLTAIYDKIDEWFLYEQINPLEKIKDCFDFSKIQPKGAFKTDEPELLDDEVDIDLLYIWVNEYKILKNQAVNLSNAYDISLESQTLKLKTLSEPLDMNIEDLTPLFGQGRVNKINNLTAIVGRNGSGKTTMIQMILSFYERNDTHLDQFIVVYKKEGIVHVEANVAFELTIDAQTTKEIVFKNVDKISDYFSQTSIIRYSNIYDPLNQQDSEEALARYIDVTTQSIIEDEDSYLLAYDQIKMIRFILDYQTICFEHLPVDSENKFLSPVIPLPYINVEDRDGDKSMTIDLPRLVGGHKKEHFQEVLKDLEEYFSTIERELSNNQLDKNIELRVSGLSAGGYSRLTLFSRVHWLCHLLRNDRDNQQSGNQLKRKVIIVLDEAESHYHPEWLRCFVFDLIYILSNSFSLVENVKSVEIIMATNSPFLAGDVPLEQTIFLSRDSEEATDIGQTFGQNIHKLIKKSFFIDELFGKYADYKITKVIDALRGEPIEDVKERKVLLRAIERIGEPILRQVLLNDYYSIYEKEEDINALIKVYEERIQRLKGNMR